MEATEEGDYWQSWDPLIAGVRESMKAQVAPHIPAPSRPRALWARFMSAFWAARQRWLDAVYVAGVALLGAAGLSWLIVTWPPTTDNSTFTGVVTSAAAATAFSGAIASAISIPFNAASGIAAGYTAEILRRPGPWLAGLYLVVQAGALFLLAVAGPDEDAAVAAGLLASTAFGVVWLVVRGLLHSADLHSVATNQAAFLRKNAREGLAELRKDLRRSISPKIRTEELLDIVSRPAERNLLAGMLRHQREGFRSMVSQERFSEAIVFWDGIRGTFLDYAEASNGDIGSHDGPVQVLFATIDELITPGIKGSRDDVATRCIDSLSELASKEYSSYEYGVVRSNLLTYLRKWTLTTWMNDESFVPARCVATLGACHNHFAKYGDYSDQEHILRAIVDLAESATETDRVHIGTSALDALVNALPAIAEARDKRIRRHMLGTWRKMATQAAHLRLKELDVFFQRPTEVLLPGISIGRKGLQELLWNAAARAADPDGAADVIKASADWLREVLPLLARVDSNRHKKPIQEGFAVLCATAQLAIVLRLDQQVREQLAGDLAEIATGWADTLDNATARELVLDDDAGEMMWSALLAIAALGGDPEILSGSCERIISEVGPLEEFETISNDLGVATSRRR